VDLVQLDKWHTYFFNVAAETAKLSYATRLKVGAVAVRDRRIVCCGFNGTAPGRPNVCEKDNVTLDETLHAEQNLISYAARHGISLEHCTLYLTHAPCLKCASMILSCGFSKVFFVEEYRSADGIEYLRSAGITIIKKE
jgi:dCMP deaminase